MTIRFEAFISLAFLDSASNYYHDRCNEKYQNVVLLRLQRWRILLLSNLAFYKGTYCTLYWRPINVNKLTQYDFFPSHAVIPGLFVCHMAHRTYFSSLSLIGRTADCLNLFNFLVPRRGFLWIEPLSYPRNMIDVFHINLLILWLRKCNFLLKFLLMATRQHLRVFFTQSLSRIQITLYSVLGLSFDF